MSNKLKITTKGIGSFVGANFNMGGHIKRDMENMETFVMKRTEALTQYGNGNMDVVDGAIFWENISSYVKNKDIIKDEMHKA